MSSPTAACLCGTVHPAGFTCGPADIAIRHDSREKPCRCHDAPANGPDHDASDVRGHAHEDGICCGHDRAVQEPGVSTVAGEASATRAVYRIANMDCPMEEALIRKKLEGMPGITGLE
ncbi:MAG: hypothetical protein LBQ10_05865, partial [Desulfovibrio sp.]|nr:hypothetical protein [Desulfovibrio sp.]